MSGALTVPQVAAAQEAKEDQINEATARLEEAITEKLDINTTSGSVTVTTDQMQRHWYFKRTDNTASRTVTFPAVNRPFWFENAGTTAVTVALGSASFSLAAGEIGAFYADGTANGLKKISSSLGATATQTTLAGTTSGSAIWSQPVSTPVWKRVVVYLSAYYNSTGSAQTITFPTPFTQTPILVANSDPEATVSTTTLTLPASMSGAVTGWIIIEGY